MFVLITTVILCYFKWYSLKLGPRTSDSGSESQDLGPGTWDLGSRNWDPVPRIQGPGPWTSRPRDTGPRTPYPATQELGPRIPGTGAQDPWPQDLVLRTRDSRLQNLGPWQLQNNSLKSKNSLTSKRDNTKYYFTYFFAHKDYWIFFLELRKDSERVQKDFGYLWFFVKWFIYNYSQTIWE